MLRKHALNMVLYAVDVAFYEKPWENWECRLSTNNNPNVGWKLLFEAPIWHPETEYRRKPDAPVWQLEQIRVLAGAHNELAKSIPCQTPAAYSPPPVAPRDAYGARINADQALSERLEVVETALASLQSLMSAHDVVHQTTNGRIDRLGDVLSSIATQLARMPSVEMVERMVAEKLAADILPRSSKYCEDEGCPHHGTPHVCVSVKETKRHAKHWRHYMKAVIAAGWTEAQFNEYVDGLPDHD